MDSVVPKTAQAIDTRNLDAVVEVALELAKKHFAGLMSGTRIAMQEDESRGTEYLEIAVIVSGNPQSISDAHTCFLHDWGARMPLEGRRQVRVTYGFA